MQAHFAAPMPRKKRISVDNPLFKRNGYLIFVLLFSIGGILIFVRYDEPLGAILILCIGIAYSVYLKVKLPLLADEVYDCGDCLLVCHEGQEREYPFTQIASVKKRPWSMIGFPMNTFLLEMKDGTKIHLIMLWSAALSRDLWRRMKNKA